MMKVDFLHEPELEFGIGRHIDIRFGLMNYGPLDFERPLAPKHIKLGIVGTLETIEGVLRWLERCRNEIPAKPSRQPNLFPKFPGFNHERGFRASLLMDQQLQREIPIRTFENLRKLPDTSEIIQEAVEIFFTELCYLAEKAAANVFICAVPMVLLDLLEERSSTLVTPLNEPEEEEKQIHIDFHHLLKSRVMEIKTPIQIILPMTYDESKRRRQKGQSEKVRTLQDEATRAWNFHAALYYKAGGAPWRLVRDASEWTTCYVGVSFYQTLDRSKLLTSMAQVFNERGDGIIVRGGMAKISKDDKQPHLSEKDAYQLLHDALTKYRQEHRTLPARVVIHKSSHYSNEELTGFTEAARNQRIDLVDLISISTSLTRLFRVGAYPPMRGTILCLDNKSCVLYTRGSVNFFSTYPGMYIPKPLLFRCESTEHTPLFLAQEILALTKMNWNNTQFDGGEPITLRAAHQVASILKYIGEKDPIASRYSFYM